MFGKAEKETTPGYSVIIFVVLPYYDTRSLFRLVTTVKTGLRSTHEVFNNHQNQLEECAEYFLAQIYPGLNVLLYL